MLSRSTSSSMDMRPWHLLRRFRLQLRSSTIRPALSITLPLLLPLLAGRNASEEMIASRRASRTLIIAMAPNSATATTTAPATRWDKVAVASEIIRMLTSATCAYPTPTVPATTRPRPGRRRRNGLVLDAGSEMRLTSSMGSQAMIASSMNV